jgi:hypothetical protein
MPTETELKSAEIRGLFLRNEEDPITDSVTVRELNTAECRGTANNMPTRCNSAIYRRQGIFIKCAEEKQQILSLCKLNSALHQTLL